MNVIMTMPPDKPTPATLDYRRDNPQPLSRLGQWISLLLVWTLGLISWTFWMGLCVLAVIRLLS